jgi:hypothetical protein
MPRSVVANREDEAPPGTGRDLGISGGAQRDRVEDRVLDERLQGERRNGD